VVTPQNPMHPLVPTRAAHPPPSETAPAFGIPVEEAVVALQTDAYKELINKLAWVIGSFYRVSYSSSRLPPRQYAVRVAKAILSTHGYPRKIAK